MEIKTTSRTLLFRGVLILGRQNMCKYCEEIERDIENKYPYADWNVGEDCREWNERVKEIPSNNIEFEEWADENYACTCPYCGVIICGWCV